jgi:phosphate/sulfate permease
MAKILAFWILTIPCAALLSAFLFRVVNGVVG